MRDYHECLAYVDHLHAEHRRLHQLLAQVRAVLNPALRADPEPSPGDPVSALEKLRTELGQHFAEEEGGGCLEEAVSRCPHLSAEVTRVEREHPELLLSVDRMIAQLRDRAADEPGDHGLQHEFESLCRRLHAHENAEDEVLKLAFGADYDGDETAQPTLILDT